MSSAAPFLLVNPDFSKMDVLKAYAYTIVAPAIHYWRQTIEIKKEDQMARMKAERIFNPLHLMGNKILQTCTSTNHTSVKTNVLLSLTSFRSSSDVMPNAIALYLLISSFIPSRRGRISGCPMRTSLILAGHTRQPEPRMTHHTSPTHQMLLAASLLRASRALCLHLNHALPACDWRVRMLPSYKGFFLLSRVYLGAG